ncbi:hypothetical protein GOV11_00875 [Candidatus Woesearchaeota archaeon]|nr:hypothetical protein [Candidatus Woesearchaeota archaeon]
MMGSDELIEFEQDYYEELFEEFVQRYSNEYDTWVADKPGMSKEDYQEGFITHMQDLWDSFVIDSCTEHYADCGDSEYERMKDDQMEAQRINNNS